MKCTKPNSTHVTVKWAVVVAVAAFVIGLSFITPPAAASADSGPCGTPPTQYHHCGRNEAGQCEEQVPRCQGDPVDNWPLHTRCCYSIGFGEWSICYTYVGSWTCCASPEGDPPRWVSECQVSGPFFGMQCDPPSGLCLRIIR
jgi:hypothetical protein